MPVDRVCVCYIRLLRCVGRGSLSLYIVDAYAEMVIDVSAWSSVRPEEIYRRIITWSTTADRDIFHERLAPRPFSYLAIPLLSIKLLIFINPSPARLLVVKPLDMLLLQFGIPSHLTSDIHLLLVPLTSSKNVPFHPPRLVMFST